ncbi:BspA family leucine-rich repeat surface protein [uncultured Aquimarina sp.]|uniref:BspA family leucine-rich repeat surface protein n=1 Tax=uncultured Aquimarina sp. TaxID=575652 RepID=UPI002611E5EF|nr:BspA family leucine-rich repeat surface protein [uncultured Aquimarina sp.]
MKHFYITLFFIVSFFTAGFAQNEFITTWETTTADESITIPTTESGYNYTVDWGDGTIETGFIGDATHEYTDADTHTVKISGDFPRIYFNNSGDKDKILTVEQWGNIAWNSFVDAFYGCSNLDIIAIDAPDLSNVTSVARMFSGCATLGTSSTLDFSNWDTSGVLLFGSMFRNASNFNSASITNWDVGKATAFVLMFNNATTFNQDISNWNIGENVTGTINLGSMFLNAKNFDQNLGTWNLEKVTNINNMLSDTGLSIVNYDETLIGWAEDINTPSGLNLGASNLTYCFGAEARNTLTDPTGLNWSITDDVAAACDLTDFFITTWETTENNESITIPTTGDGYDYIVDWGDGTTTTLETGNATHQYTQAGSYNVKITGDFPRIYFNNSGDKDKILEVKQWGSIAWTNFNEAFNGCTNLDVTASDAPDLSNVKFLIRIFNRCTRLGTSESLDFSNWDTSGIENFAAAFLNASAFNSETIKNWDVSSGHTFVQMFSRATSFNQDISNWNIGENSNGTINMSLMFNNATNFNKSLGNWDIGKVTNMNNMLNNSGLSQQNYDATLLGWATDVSGDLSDGIDDIPTGIDLGASGLTYCLGESARTTLTDTNNNWDITDGGLDCAFEEGFITTWQTTEADETIGIPTIEDGYNYSISWGDGEQDDAITGNATHTYATPGTYTVKIKGDFPRIYFRNSGYEEKIQTIEQWGTQEWTSMDTAFYGCSNLVLEASDTPILTSATSLEFMFYGNTALEDTQDVMNTWDVSTITNMQFMFDGATTFNENIADWDVGNVYNFNYMFNKATNFNQNIEVWNIGEHVPDLIAMVFMFSECTAFNQPLNNWDMSKVGGISGMFRLATNFNQPLNNWDVSNVQNMVFTFVNASKFNQNIGNWDISSVTDMMFMLDNSDLSTENYDATLKGWATLEDGEVAIPTGINFRATGLNYCASAYERNELDTTYQWNITDAGSLCDSESAFVTTWSVVDGDLNIEIPTTGDGYFYTVDWGDGSSDAGQAANASHTYATSGTYTVTITGSFPRIYFNNLGDKDKIVAVNQWGTQQWTSMESAFYGCTNLIIDTSDTPDLAGVTSLRAMFRDNTNLVDVQGTVANWDVRTIVDLGQMFMNTDKFNTTLEFWFFRAAEDLSEMFRGAKMFNQGIGFPYFAKTFEGMFRDAIVFNQPIYWSTPEVIILKDMFNGATSFDQNLGLFKIQSVTDMTGMFSNAGLSTQNYDQTLSGWFLSDLRPNDITFDAGDSQYCLAGDIIEQLTNTYGWQITDGGAGCDENDVFVMTWDLSTERRFDMPTSGDGYDYTIHLSTGDIFHVTTNGLGIGRSENLGMLTVRIYGDFPRFDFDKQFVNKEKLVAIEQWGSLQLLEADGAFDGCSNLVLNADDVPDLSQLSSTAAMFRGCTSLVDSKDTMKDWDMSTIENTSAMFASCNLFNEAIGNWTMDSVDDMEGMFQLANSFNQDISDWNVSNVTNFEDLFLGATDFNQSLASWDISAASDMGDMLVNSGMSQENYDATLIGWATLEAGETQIPANFTLDASATYCLAEDARNTLTGTTYNWIINDGGKFCSDEAFITTWAVEASQSITIPVDNQFNYNYSIDWGDGTIEHNQTGEIVHAYTDAGTYTVSIVGEFPAISFNRATGAIRDRLQTVEQWGTQQWVTMQGAFEFCKNLKLNADDVPDLSQVNDMGDMFSGCIYFEDLKDNIGSWDMSTITNIAYMFTECADFNEDISGWTFNNLEYTFVAFEGNQKFNQDISNWDMSKVKDMSYMFEDAVSFNQPIGKWTLGSVESMEGLFHGATTFNQELSNWDFSQVQDVGDLFYEATAFNQDLSNWDISSVSNMSRMFTNSGMTQENYDKTLIGWATLEDGETQIPTDLTLDADTTYCLAEAAHDTLTSDTYNWIINDGGKFCTDEAFITTWLVTDGDEVIIPIFGSYTYNYNIDWGDGTVEYGLTAQASHIYTTGDTYEVKITGEFPALFFHESGSRLKLQTIEQWGTQQWRRLINGFSTCVNLKLNADDVPDLSLIDSTGSMFEGCTNFEDLKDQIGNWDMSNITLISRMFNECSIFNENISDWTFTKLTRAVHTFRNATSFNQDISNWDMSQVDDMEGMFLRAKAFNQPIGNWTLNEVGYMTSFLEEASSFNQDLSNWNMSEVYDIRYMFYAASSFNQDLSSWDISNVEGFDDFFTGSGMTQENYDKTLIGWATLDAGETEIPTNLTLNSDVTYCLAEAARDTLTGSLYNWIINDGGQGCVAPVITLVGDNPQVIEKGDTYTELGAEVTYGATLTINATSVDTDRVGSYTVTYDATNTVSGATATQVNRMVEVVDTTAPVITLNGPNPQIIELGDPYIELGATTDDGSAVVINASAFVDAIGSYSITYNAMDASGNNAVEVIRTVNVVDATAPVITLTGANPQTIELGAGYTELGATTDDGSALLINASAFVDAIGSYSITYNAMDASGNNAVEVTRMVNVVDTTAPVITLTGANPQTIELGAGYSELGATTDDGSVVSINTSEFMDAVGSYTIYYDATDTAGNAALQVTRIVNVVDTTNPTVVCQNIIVQLDDSGNANITAAMVDNGSTDLSGIASLAIDVTDFDCTTIGDNTVILTITDANGNSDMCMTTVTVEDAIDPEFDMVTVPIDMNVTFDTGDMYTLADFTSGVVVTDNCDTNRTALATTITQNPVAGTLLGVGDHVITLTATDDNANEQTTTFTITVTDDVLSVGENTEEAFTLYPNPAKQQFQVSGFSGEAELSIYDVNGRSLLIEKVDAGQSISIQELPNGVYFVKIAIGNTYKTIRLMKNE